jgi:hypothetical protein
MEYNTPQRRRQPDLLVGRLLIHDIGSVVAKVKRQYTTLHTIVRSEQSHRKFLAMEGNGTNVIFHLIFRIGKAIQNSLQCFQ